MQDKRERLSELLQNSCKNQSPLADVGELHKVDHTEEESEARPVEDCEQQESPQTGPLMSDHSSAGRECQVIGETPIQDTPESRSQHPVQDGSLNSKGKEGKGEPPDQVLCPPSVPCSATKSIRRNSILLGEYTGTPVTNPRLNRHLAALRRRASIGSGFADTPPSSGLSTMKRSLRTAVLRGDTPKRCHRELTASPMSASFSIFDLSQASPGIYMPTAKDFDISGTELAEDMAGNLVAGIFSMSEPQPQDKILEQPFNNNKINARQPDAEVHENTEHNGANNYDGESPDHQSSNAVYTMEKGEEPAHLLFRFPESCLFASVSPSGRYMAVVLGQLSTQTPTELLVLQVHDGSRDTVFSMKIVTNFPLQRSPMLPNDIKPNSGSIALVEDKFGNPVVILGGLLELADAQTQSSYPSLSVLPCCSTFSQSVRNMISIETDIPIICISTIQGDENRILVSSLFLEDGIQTMKFDQMWQSFMWGPHLRIPDIAADTYRISRLVATRNQCLAKLVDDSNPYACMYWEDFAEEGQLKYSQQLYLISDGSSLTNIGVWSAVVPHLSCSPSSSMDRLTKDPIWNKAGGKDMVCHLCVYVCLVFLSDRCLHGTVYASLPEMVFYTDVCRCVYIQGTAHRCVLYATEHIIVLGNNSGAIDIIHPDKKKARRLSGIPIEPGSITSLAAIPATSHPAGTELMTTKMDHETMILVTFSSGDCAFLFESHIM